MKKLFAIFALLISSVAFGWTIKESALDTDVKVIVNDGGVFKEAMKVDGSTAEVSFLNTPKVGSVAMRSIVATGTESGASIIAGPVTSCAAPSAPSLQYLRWTKYSDGMMHVTGYATTVTNQNGGCNVSAEVTIPQSFASQTVWQKWCAAGTRNTSATGASGYQRCSVADEKDNVNKIRMVTEHLGSWTAGNLQQVNMYFNAWGQY